MSNDNKVLERFDDQINPEIKLNVLFYSLLRNKNLIAVTTLIGLSLSFFINSYVKNLWEGEFEIVLEDKKNNNESFNFLRNSNFDIFNQDRSLKTEVEILKSPSVLMKIYKFVQSEKKKESIKYEPVPFKKWEKSFDIKQKQGTSIVQISYEDNKKELILPVLEKISKTYQEYSGKKRKRNLELSINYLESQVAKYKNKSSKSFKAAQEFAIREDLNINEFNPIQPPSQITDNLQNKDSSNENVSINNTTLLMGSIVGLEEIRVNSTNKIKNIEIQIDKIKKMDDDSDEIQYIGSTIPGLVKTGLPKKLENIETRIAENRFLFKDNDKSYIQLKERRNLLIKLLKKRAIGYLKADKLSTEVLLDTVLKPKETIIKYRELVREVTRNEKTLLSLEDKLNLVKLENSRYQDPWQLITQPTLNPQAVSPKRTRNISLGLLLGFLTGCTISILNQSKKDKILFTEDLKKLTDFNLLAEINLVKEASAKEYFELIFNNLIKTKVKEIFIYLPESIQSDQLNLLKNYLAIYKDKIKLSEGNNLVQGCEPESILVFINLGYTSRKEIIEIDKKLALIDINNVGYISLTDMTSPRL